MENAHSSKESSKLLARCVSKASGPSILNTFIGEERAILADACRFYFSPEHPTMIRAYMEVRFRIASANEARPSENETALEGPSFATFRRALNAAALCGEGPFVSPFQFGTRR